jgi:hypothetical protein
MTAITINHEATDLYGQAIPQAVFLALIGDLNHIIGDSAIGNKEYYCHMMTIRREYLLGLFEKECHHRFQIRADSC